MTPLKKLKKLCGRRAWRSDAFTLVELLLVVTIMIILLSMLLPALQQVRHKARQIHCASNQKQLGVCLISYLGDSNDFFPPQRWGSSIYWTQLLSDYLPPPKGKYSYRTSPSAVISDVFRCPAYSPQPADVYGFTPQYGYNTRGLGREDYVNPPVKAGMVSGPSNTMALVDSTKTTYVSYPSLLDFRHLNRINVLFCDGHASSKSQLCLKGTTVDYGLAASTWPWNEYHTASKWMAADN